MVHYLHTDKVLDGLHLIFVELPKFKAKNFTEKKMQVLWLRFLTEIGRDGADEVSQDLLDNPQTAQALEIVKESALSKEELAVYDGFWDYVSRKKTEIADLERERDAANARADAIAEQLRQTARNLKKAGMSVEQIAAATGLAADEIEKL